MKKKKQECPVCKRETRFPTAHEIWFNCKMLWLMETSELLDDEE